MTDTGIHSTPEVETFPSVERFDNRSPAVEPFEPLQDSHVSRPWREGHVSRPWREDSHRGSDNPSPALSLFFRSKFPEVKPFEPLQDSRRGSDNGSPLENDVEKPKFVEPYKREEDLPDCIIIQKGDERTQETKWYYEVTCDHCKSILLTRSVEKMTHSDSWNIYPNFKYRFWCPCCKNTSTVIAFNVRSYHPMFFRNPAMSLRHG